MKLADNTQRSGIIMAYIGGSRTLNIPFIQCCKIYKYSGNLKTTSCTVPQYIDFNCGHLKTIIALSHVDMHFS
jgi:hypothetical protein